MGNSKIVSLYNDIWIAMNGNYMLGNTSFHEQIMEALGIRGCRAQLFLILENIVL